MLLVFAFSSAYQVQPIVNGELGRHCRVNGPLICERLAGAAPCIWPGRQGTFEGFTCERGVVAREPSEPNGDGSEFIGSRDLGCKHQHSIVPLAYLRDYI